MGAREHSVDRLGRAMFGFDREEVRAAFAEVDRESEQLRAELVAARLELERLRIESARSANDDDVRIALAGARRGLEEARESVEAERKLILDAARRHADEIVQRAQRRVSEESWELHRAKIERQRFVENFRRALLKHLDELDRLSEEPAASAAVHVPDARFGASAPADARQYVPPGFEAPTRAS